MEDTTMALLRYGSFNEWGGEAVINRVMGETSAARLAVRVNSNDGYAENVPTGRGLEGGRQYGARLSLSNQSGAWSLLGQVDVSRDRMDGHARIPVTASGTAPSLRPATTPPGESMQRMTAAGFLAVSSRTRERIPS